MAPGTPAPPTDFGAVRQELGLPPAADSAAFPPDVLAEAAEAAGRTDFGDREDATDLPLVTIDPPGSMDLDQALLVLRRGSGFTLHYAIADVPAFVRPDGPLDLETRRRGQTLYLPDASVPLHPPVLSAGAASLLPGQVRPAALWTIELEADGEPTGMRVRRAMVRSVARLDYQGVQDELDAGRAHPSVEPLPDLGRLRRAAAAARGAVELELPEQEVAPDGTGWLIVLRRRTEVDAWNAEMSLLTGMCAARLMLDAGVGVLRTLPEPDAAAVAHLRQAARALGIDWPDGATPAAVLSTLDPADPAALAVFTGATRLLRGAGYVAFDGAPPERAWHTGIGAPYAHVTAPLRRLVDRYGAEVCLAVSAGAEVPDWTRAALPTLPELMAGSDRLAAQVDRACLDQVESWLLHPRVGERFEAIVLRGTRDRDAATAPADAGTARPADGSSTARPPDGAPAEDRPAESRAAESKPAESKPAEGRAATQAQAEVFITEPPTLARCVGDGLPDGERVPVTLVQADPVARKVLFAADGAVPAVKE
ncbi:MAG TPA: RNB domain-containing ribonuclease [Pseudonocardiaceae bacterium]